LQLVHQAKSCLDLLHLPHDSMSCPICNKLLHHICEYCNISKPFPPPCHRLLTLSVPVD
jgi:hypothetical protein